MKIYLFIVFMCLVSNAVSAESIVWVEQECASKMSRPVVKYFCEQERQTLNGLINLRIRAFASTTSKESLTKAIQDKLTWGSSALLCQIKNSLEEQIACIKSAIAETYPNTIPEEELDYVQIDKAKKNTKDMVESIKTDAFRCLYENIYRLDDGVSQADIVAKGASSKCIGIANEYTFALSETFIIDEFIDSPTISLEKTRALAADMIGGDRAVSAVLDSRASKKEDKIKKMQEQRNVERKKQEKKKNKLVNS